MNKRFKPIILLAIIFTLFYANAYSQGGKIKWKRRTAPVKPALNLFHSPHGIDLPSATMLQKGDWEFEISHRFVPSLGSGIEHLYGFDGPVNMRIALGWALHNNTIMTLGRSNVNDNIDLGLKQKIYEGNLGGIPLITALRLLAAWNSSPAYFEIQDRDKKNTRNWQGVAQFILNTRLFRKAYLGVVPSYLYNTDIRFEKKTKDTFRLGVLIQYYVSPFWSILAEWSPYVSGYKLLVGQEETPVSFGIELETGGHFFKVFLTNNKFLNSSQFLAGADIPLERNDWRLGFGITRVLKFSKTQ
ncbi:MAG: hypothetical protein Kow0037_21740 [Calditrichia bacterium]